jgi:hypothetical protein
MDEDIPEDPHCKVCGGPIRWNNKFQVCCRTDACNRERHRLWHEAKTEALPERPFAKCKRPGCPEKREIYGYCKMHGARFKRLGDPGPLGPLKKPIIFHAGDVVGEWTVLQDYEKGKELRNDRRVMCRCTCGTERPVFVAGLANGASHSCGHGAPGGRRKLRRSTDSPYLHAGSVFGRLTLLADALRSSDSVRCRCECGAEVERIASCIKAGNTSSCGCARNRHGLSTHPLYGTWRGMVDRTTKPHSTSYASYGGRGIGLCDRWQGIPDGFLNFVADVGERPHGMTLDRIDNDLGYSPGNVRWADSKTQGLNKRTVHALTRERDVLLAQLASVTEALSAVKPQRAPRRPAPRMEATLF